MLRSALNQEARHELLTGRTPRSQPIFGPAETIPCRRQNTNTTVMMPDATLKRAEVVYYLIHEVHDGDALDGRIVLRVMPMTGLGGVTVGYKAVT